MKDLTNDLGLNNFLTIPAFIVVAAVLLPIFVGGIYSRAEASAIDINTLETRFAKEFQFENSKYPDLTLKTSDWVELSFYSQDDFISYQVMGESNSSPLTFTVEGLAPYKTFNLYQGSFLNSSQVTTDDSGSFSYSQDVSAPHNVWIHPSGGTTIIDQDTTLGSDLADSVEIVADNVTLNCDGHIIRDTGPIGINVNNRNNVTVENCIIEGFSTAIQYFGGSSFTLRNSTIRQNGNGVLIFFANNNEFRNNVFSDNSELGLFWNGSGGNLMRDNAFSNNGFNMTIDVPSSQANDIDTSNTINGKVMKYLSGVNNVDIVGSIDFGYLGIENSSNIRVIGATLPSDNGEGILVVNSSNVLIEDVKVSGNRRGISFFSVSSGTISGVAASENSFAGIHISSGNNIVVDSSFTINNGSSGINLVGSGHKVTNSTIEGNNEGLSTIFGSNFDVTGNVIVNNTFGARFFFDKNNTFEENNFIDNQTALGFLVSGNNTVFHNNFIEQDGSIEVEIVSASNLAFDQNSEGNHWSDFSVPGDGCFDTSPRDGICDSARPVNGFADNFPFVEAGGWEAEEPVPVVIVPGIMGSRLNRVSDGEEVWPKTGGLDGMAFSFTDSYLNELGLNPSGDQIGGTEMIPSSVIQSELRVAFYGNLRKAFLDEGYELDKTLMEVPYDWRLDIRDEIARLDTTITEVLSESPSGKVNIVAHSMGGLLVKEYLAGLADVSFVDKVILAGVPQLGAPESFKSLNYGDNMGFEFGFIDILNPDRIKIISQNMPAVYELLPSRRYVDINGGYVKDFRGESTQILTYDETNDFMTADTNDSRNPTLLSSADDFHSTLDIQAVNAPEIYNFAGCRNPETVAGINIYADGEFDLVSGPGDGTVPLTSAVNLAGGFTNFFVSHAETGIDHLGLVKDSRTLDMMTAIISDESFTVPSGISTLNSICFPDPQTSLVERFLRFSTHSPVELHIYDLQGRHVGPNPNGDIDLAIPGSSFTTIGENSFAFVPVGNAYRVEVRGLSEGEFTLKAKSFDGSTLVRTVAYSNIPLQSASTTAEVTLADFDGNLALNIDEDGDGTTDTTIQPNGVLSGDEAEDSAPPQISANVPAEVVVGDTFAVDFSVTDGLSGVAASSVSATFDGVPVENGDVVTVADPGVHVLRVSGEDNAGNPAVREFTIPGIYGFSGFLSPIKSGGEGTYKRGRTLPVKFRLTDAGGNFIPNVTATLSIARVTGDTIGAEEPALSTSAADTGNIFRYDGEKDQYVYNLSTNTVNVGVWRLFADLDDGKRYEVDISIR